MPVNKEKTFKLMKEQCPHFYSLLREFNDVFQLKAVGIKNDNEAWWFGEFDPPKDLNVKITGRRW